MTKKMDIAAGSYQISFIASAASSNQPAYVAIDDVKLMPGPCSQQSQLYNIMYDIKMSYEQNLRKSNKFRINFKYIESEQRNILFLFFE